MRRAALEAHIGRCADMLAVLAPACGLRPRWLSGRFLRFHELVAAGREGVIYELVAAFACGRLAGVAYLTQGPTPSAVGAGVASLAAAAQAFVREEGWPAQDTDRVARIVRLGFPDLAALAYASPAAPALGVAVVPRRHGSGLKLYLNTRLDARHPHRGRIAALLDHLGLDGLAAYDALCSHVRAGFYGVGVDLEPGGGVRAKLYARLPARELAPHLEGLTATLGLEPFVPPALQFVSDLETPGAVAPVEVGVGLSPGTLPTLKLTRFFAPSAAADADVEAVRRLLRACSYPDEAISRALELTGAPRLQGHPLHGAGVELSGPGGVPRVNVYLQPPP